MYDGRRVRHRSGGVAHILANAKLGCYETVSCRRPARDTAWLLLLSSYARYDASQWSQE